ncbi:MAG TPA: hypothetical protein DC049_04265 [Spirochaetia bacterium]|nr:hypothetical protein [Spirochaetia bacterium]
MIKAFYFLFIVMHFFYLSAQDIWTDKGEIFTDNRNFTNNDIIYIVLDGNLVFKYKSSFDRKKTSSGDEKKPASEYLDFLPEISFENQAGRSAESKADYTSGLQGLIAGRIAGKTGDYIYSFQAGQSIMVNGKTERIVISGFFDSRDMDKRNYISSRKIADAVINYAGYEISKSSLLRAQDMEFPQSATNREPVKITEDAKKRLFLEQFNNILNLFF